MSVQAIYKVIRIGKRYDVTQIGDITLIRAKRGREPFTKKSTEFEQHIWDLTHRLRLCMRDLEDLSRLMYDWQDHLDHPSAPKVDKETAVQLTTTMQSTRSVLNKILKKAGLD